MILETDLSTASLDVISAHEPNPHDFYYVFFQDYRICEDTLVTCWFYVDRRYIYTGLTSPRFTNLISPGGPAAKMLLPDIGHNYALFFCPASGRFVRLDKTNTVTILDFF